MRAPRRSTPKSSSRAVPKHRRFTAGGHNEAAYRSGLEEKVAQQIADAGIKAGYEAFRIPFTQPVKERHYKPDFVLPNGIIVETKGLFQTDDRQKHIMVRGQHPDLDIRFVFSRSKAPIAKKSGTTYGMWAEKLGFKYADKLIPSEWLTEPANLKSLAALARLGFTPWRSAR